MAEITARLAERIEAAEREGRTADAAVMLDAMDEIDELRQRVPAPPPEMTYTP